MIMNDNFDICKNFKNKNLTFKIVYQTKNQQTISMFVNYKITLDIIMFIVYNKFWFSHKNQDIIIMQ